MKVPLPGQSYLVISGTVGVMVGGLNNCRRPAVLCD